MKGDEFGELAEAFNSMAKQLDESVETWEKENNITEATYDQLINAHFRKIYFKQMSPHNKLFRTDT